MKQSVEKRLDTIFTTRPLIQCSKTMYLNLIRSTASATLFQIQSFRNCCTQWSKMLLMAYPWFTHNNNIYYGELLSSFFFKSIDKRIRRILSEREKEERNLGKRHSHACTHARTLLCPCKKNQVRTSKQISARMMASISSMDTCKWSETK